MSKWGNVLAFACTHIPFQHPRFLDHLLRTRDKFKCDTVLHLGDLCDSHAISYYEHDPDGWAPGNEMKEADKHLKKWFRAFPRIKIALGNHDKLVDRKGKTVGLPKRCFRSFRERWNFPDGWEDAFEFVLDDVLYKHGAYSGRYGHVQAAIDARQSAVIAHCHSNGGVEYMANTKQIMFGMAVGCGIDIKRYTFAYGVDFKRRPVLGCGVVTEKGRFSQFIPMKMG